MYTVRPIWLAEQIAVSDPPTDWRLLLETWSLHWHLDRRRSNHGDDLGPNHSGLRRQLGLWEHANQKRHAKTHRHIILWMNRIDEGFLVEEAGVMGIDNSRLRRDGEPTARDFVRQYGVILSGALLACCN